MDVSRCSSVEYRAYAATRLITGPDERGDLVLGAVCAPAWLAAGKLSECLCWMVEDVELSRLDMAS